MTSDPFDSAMSASEQPQDRTYFGEVTIVDAWHCVLERGVGKRPFDPTRDQPEQRRTCIKLGVAPLRGSFVVEQESLDFEKAWLKHTLPSLRKLGVGLRDLKGKFVRARRVHTGEEYTNKQGEIKHRTAVEFLEIFPNQQACEQASEQFWAQRSSKNGTSGTSNGSATQPGRVETAPLPADLGQAEPDAGANAERQFALTSLGAMWKASGRNAEIFKNLVGQNPLISKYYPITHPQVVALMNGSIDEEELAGARPF